LSHLSSNRENLLHNIASRIRQSLELPEILATATTEIRQFLGIDRVNIYRFEPDGSGQVVAEAIAHHHLPSLLHLYFPATDIPSTARDLFVQARQRVVTDVVAQRKAVHRVEDGRTQGEEGEERDIRYSPAHACHLEYLKAMGVKASAVFPILHQQKLWGLLASHHSKPHHFSEPELQIVQLLVDQISIAIAQSDLLAQTRQRSFQEAAVNNISRLLHCPLPPQRSRQLVLEAAVESLGGSGGRLYLVSEPMETAAQLYVCGQQSQHPALEEDPAWRQLLNFQADGMETAGLTRAIASWHNDTSPFLPPPIVPQPTAMGGAQATDPALDRRSLPTLEPSPFQSDTPSSKNSSNSSSKNSSNSSFNGSASGSASGSSHGLLSSQTRSLTLQQIQEIPDGQTLYAGFATSPIRSILLVPLDFQGQFMGYLCVFRNGFDHEIKWAGKLDPDTRQRLPQLSFDAWLEVRREQAVLWTSHDIQLAQSIGMHLYMAVMQRRVEALIRYQASHDALTALPNRLLFAEQLVLALADAQHHDAMVGVAFLDLDRFKTINDTLGHAIGDALLQQVAERLRQCLRKGDAIARWGGDEFTLLLPHLSSAEDISCVAKHILDHLSQPFWVADQEFYITASLGLALAPYDGQDVETLLKHADTAMYQAKYQGKNNFQIYYEETNHRTREHLSLESDLHKALRRHELLLYYQPQIDLRTRTMIGVEALLRWQHPERGFISPGQFIPLAEETGLINRIGEWVLREACRQNQAWQAMGLAPLRMAVNLSAKQFQQPRLVNVILQILEETGLDPRFLEVEITESAVMHDIPFTITTLRQLQDIGIQVAIDDFGTGYSSLHAIKHFPLNTLKIDQSFVREAWHDPSDAAIARTILALGRGLNLHTLAEGVETQEQLDWLNSLGCDMAQGFFFSRPMPADEVVALLQNPTRLFQGIQPTPQPPHVAL